MVTAGLPRTATSYWKSYGALAVGSAAVTAFAGSFGGLVVLLAAPDAAIYYLIAAVSLTVHAPAMYISDRLAGRPSADETDDELTLTPALVVVLGAFLSGLLLLATGASVALSVLGLPAFASVFVAAYYPVVDAWLSRRDLPSPSSLVYVLVVWVVLTVFDVRLPDRIPVLGQLVTPQSSPR